MLTVSEIEKELERRKGLSSAVDLFNRAKEAGMEAARNCVPKPMHIVGYGKIDDGECGFSAVHISCKGKGRKFIEELKKEGIAGDINSFREITKSICGSGYNWGICLFSQSYDRHIAAAREIVRVLKEAGINCYYTANLD